MAEKEGNEKDAKTNEEEYVPIRKQLIDCLIDWFYWFAIIGPVHIVRTDFLFTKIMWAFGIIAATGGGFYFLAQCAITFASFGVLNQITIAKQYPTYFPAVTLCNLNPFNDVVNRSAEYIDTLLITNGLFDFLNFTNTDALEQKQGSNNTIQLLDDLIEKLRRLVVADSNLTTATRRNLGYELKGELMSSCSFNGKTCSDTDFWYSRSYDYGNCFTFNSGYNSAGAQVDLLQTSKTGVGEGLQIEIMVGNPADVRFAYKTGLYLIVHNQSFSPLEVMENGVFLSTGFDSYVAIEREFYSKQPYPYSNCIDDFSKPVNDYAKKLYGYMSDAKATVYSQDFCNNICFQDQLIDKCGCANAHFPTLRDAVYCTTAAQVSCAEDFESQFNSANLDTQCKTACPVRCNYINYDLSITSAFFPSTFYLNMLKTKSDFTDDYDLSSASALKKLRETVLKFTVSYSDLKYKQIQEIPVMDEAGLFGNIGGTIGYFTGFIFVTFFQFPHLIIDVIRLVYLDRKKRKNEKQD